MGYTLGQVRVLSKAVDRQRRRREQSLAVLVRAASQYDAEDFAKFLEL